MITDREMWGMLTNKRALRSDQKRLIDELKVCYAKIALHYKAVQDNQRMREEAVILIHTIDSMRDKIKELSK